MSSYPGRVLLFSILIMSAYGCEDESTMNSKASIDNVNFNMDVNNVNKLADKRIYFGHQSVGMNILDGIDQLAAVNPDLKLKVLESKNLATIDGPAFVHSPIGDNERIDLKLKDFETVINTSGENKTDIAIIKFCYLDINKTTDVDMVFKNYKDTMDRLEKSYPQTKFIHVTTPLTVTETTLRSMIKKLLGRPDNNIARAAFNQKIINTYGSTGHVFDLARIESTYPDGGRSTFKANGEVYYSLIPEYASDSGHLNDLGSKIAGKELLGFLATIQ